MSASEAKYCSLTSDSDAGSLVCTMPAAVLRTIAFGASSLSTTDEKAASLPSAVGMTARTLAAACAPLAVLSFASAASISGRSAAPLSTRPSSSSQPRSVSISSPGSVTVPSTRPVRVSTCADVDAMLAKNLTNWNCESDAASAPFASSHSASPSCSIVAARRPGETYMRATVSSCDSVVRIVVDSVSVAMLRSTSST